MSNLKEIKREPRNKEAIELLEDILVKVTGLGFIRTTA